jgi:Ca2+-binding EF-hand superfamily protein
MCINQDELNKRKLCDFFKDNMDAWRKLFAVENTSAAHTSNLTTFLSLYFSGSHTNSYEVMKQVTKTKRKFESVDHLRNFLQSRVLEQDEKIKENETKHGDKLELFIQDNAKHLLTSSSIMLKSEIKKVVSLRRSKDVLRILKRFVSKSKKFTHVDQLMRAVKISVGFRVGDALLMRIHQHIEDNHLRLRELFKQFDQDEDGRLNERELRSLLINLKIVPERSVMKGDIVALLAVIDTQEMGYATMSSFHQV